MFLFIRMYGQQTIKGSRIQIHLMFLFICAIQYHSVWAILIQIHLMFLFIRRMLQSHTEVNYSNTSHVLIYPVQIKKKNSMFHIQIHLMFLFIVTTEYRIINPKFIQIHLMFLFI